MIKARVIQCVLKKDFLHKIAIMILLESIKKRSNTKSDTGERDWVDNLEENESQIWTETMNYTKVIFILLYTVSWIEQVIFYKTVDRAKHNSEHVRLFGCQRYKQIPIQMPVTKFEKWPVKRAVADYLK